MTEIKLSSSEFLFVFRDALNKAANPFRRYFGVDDYLSNDSLMNMGETLISFRSLREPEAIESLAAMIDAFSSATAMVTIVRSGSREDRLFLLPAGGFWSTVVLAEGFFAVDHVDIDGLTQRVHAFAEDVSDEDRFALLLTVDGAPQPFGFGWEGGSVRVFENDEWRSDSPLEPQDVTRWVVDGALSLASASASPQEAA